VQFVYNGFTQDGNKRCYSFAAVTDRERTTLYSIGVDLSLFMKYQVSLQNGPTFCLHLLQTACEGDARGLDQFRNYCAIDADFATLLAERAARAAVIAAKKPARRSFRKPPLSSQLRRQIH
jgi:hypothetical protein